MWTSLVLLSGHESILLVTFHHVAVDGWSLSVLGRELDQLYRAFTAGRPSPLSPLSMLLTAGHRGVSPQFAAVLAMSVLYLGANRQLQAYDDIRVGGTGMAQVSLNRKVVDDNPPTEVAAPSASPTDREVEHAGQPTGRARAELPGIRSVGSRSAWARVRD